MYKFFSDSGHGWLQVPLPELIALGIEKKISSYSYLDSGQAYLEEDCDFAVFYHAYEKAHGVPPKIEVFRSVNGRSHVRDFFNYHWCWLCFL